MKKYILACVCSLLSFLTIADSPVEDASWQWNNNIKIDFVYGFWNLGVIQVHMDNGEFCYLNADEKNSISIALAMRAQQSTGQIVCKKTPDKRVDGRDSRHIHRIKY